MTEIITDKRDIQWSNRRIAADATGKLIESRSGTDKGSGQTVHEVVREHEPGTPVFSTIGRYAGDERRWENALNKEREDFAAGTGAYSLYDDTPDQHDFDEEWRADALQQVEEARREQGTSGKVFGGLGGILGPKGALGKGGK